MLELGINHFGEMAYLTSIAKPDIALVTNIGTMHIEHLGSREGILKAKMEILQGLNPNGTLLLNGDEPLLWGRRGALRERYKTYYFGMDNPQCDIRASKLENTDNGVSFEVEGLGQCFPCVASTRRGHAQCRRTPWRPVSTVASGVRSAHRRTSQLGLRRFDQRGHAAQITYEAERLYHHRGLLQRWARVHGGRRCLRPGAAQRRRARRIAVLGDMLELGQPGGTAEHYRIGRFAAGRADLVFGLRLQALTADCDGRRHGRHGCRRNAMFFDSHGGAGRDCWSTESGAGGRDLLFKGSREHAHGAGAGDCFWSRRCRAGSAGGATWCLILTCVTGGLMLWDLSWGSSPFRLLRALKAGPVHPGMMGPEWHNVKSRERPPWAASFSLCASSGVPWRQAGPGAGQGSDWLSGISVLLVSRGVMA